MDRKYLHSHSIQTLVNVPYTSYQIRENPESTDDCEIVVVKVRK